MVQLAELGDVCRNAVFTEGRLFERLIFDYMFSGTVTQHKCLDALRMYQNYDGGFGNGLEQDVLCPMSNGIATETALFYVDMLNGLKSSIIDDVYYWTQHQIKEDGTIMHPPAGCEAYFMQPWWQKSDPWRSFSVLGMLLHLKGLNRTNIPDSIQDLAVSFPLKNKIEIYDYPYYQFKYAERGVLDPAIQHLLRNLPQFLEENKDHYPLFTRYWHWLIPEVPIRILQEELDRMLEGLKRGHFPNPYPELPHWKATLTMDVLMILQNYKLVT